MNEQIKKYVDLVKNFWGKLTRKTKTIVFIVLGGIVVLAVVLSLVMNRTQYSVLYSGMNSDEAKAVSTELGKLNVDYKDDGGTIYVEKDKENSVRMQLSNEGYPKTTPNYDFFTSNVGVMTTDEERKIIEQYQLQQRLQAVIQTLQPVDTAYVTISVPEESSYAWDDNKKSATASVTVKMKEGSSLDSKQVNGIKRLVATSVPNLKTDDVSVINSESGEEMASSSNNSDSSSSMQITLSEFKLKIEKEYEDSVQQKVASLLSHAYGSDNIGVSVKSKMDLDKKIQDIVTYSPSTSGGKGIVSQSDEETEVTRDGSASSGAVVGTQTNSDTTTTYPGVTVNGNVITTKDKRTYNYLVSQVEEQIQSDAAALDDLTVSVVVNTNSMTDAQKQAVTGLVANAAAVDPSKVAVMAAPQNSSVNSEAQPTSGKLIPQLLGNPIVLIGAGAFVLLIILLIVLFVAKRRKARRALLENLQPAVLPEAAVPLAAPELSQARAAEAETSEEAGEESEEAGEEAEEMNGDEEEEPEESIEEIRNAMNGKENKLKRDLQEFSSNNPEIAAQLIRSWLKGDDGND